MKSPATLFFESIKDKTVAFIGLGVSHRETILLFAKQGIHTLAVDAKPEPEHDPQMLAKLKESGATLILGKYDISTLGADIIFRTPGMYYFNPELTEFRNNGGIVTSEMEVFCDLCPCPLYAITGSDGKTTTTTLISEMLKAEGKHVYLGGNIGKALLPQILDITPDDVAVVELSSFQLVSMRPTPTVSVVTNIMPNHLDIHKGGMEEYVDSKKNICQHQNAFSKTVLGADNELALSFAPLVRGELSTFSLETPVENGAYLKNDILTLVHHGKETPLFHKDEIKIPGVHNIANYLTAISAVSAVVSPKTMKTVAQTFGGVEHRIELTRERNGVRWYNDSIASSPSRTLSAIHTFPDNLVLIVGGYDKKIPYEPLAEDIINHVRVLIVMGATGPKIEAVVTSHPDYTKDKPIILHATDMAHAIALADEHSQTGDAVVLSPASASFDLYKNFEHRGKHFKELVHQLPE